MSVYIFVSVREDISGTTYPVFTKFSEHVTYGLGAVIRWRRCGKLSISGFMDDVMFSHN